MSSAPPEDDEDEKEGYKVGYGKPPKATRFRPGRSGNPKGRPRGSRTKRSGDAGTERLKAMVLEEAYRQIQVRDGDKLVEMSTVQAAVRSLSLSAVKGNQRSQRMLFDSVGAIESEQRQGRLATYEGFVDYQVRARKENAAARARGLPEPHVTPHPDHIVIDPIHGSVKIRGPFTPEEKVDWDKVRELRVYLEKQLADLEAQHQAGSGEEGLTERISALRSSIAKADAYLDNERVILSGAR
jgi:hypothetical protein